MKKSTVGLIVLTVVCVVGIAYAVFSGVLNPTSTVSTSSVPKSSENQAPASSLSSQSSSQADSSSSSVREPHTEVMKTVKSQLKLDWDKYRLTENLTDPVKLDGKTYNTFVIWDEDYQVGPLILADPDDDKLYTYVADVDKAPVELEKDEAFDTKEKSFTGTVEDGAMMSILVKTSDGKKLSVRRLGVELINLDDGFVIGNKVKVTYTGIIQGDSMIRAFVTKIEGI